MQVTNCTLQQYWVASRPLKFTSYFYVIAWLLGFIKGAAISFPEIFFEHEEVECLAYALCYFGQLARNKIQWKYLPKIFEKLEVI